MRFKALFRMCRFEIIVEALAGFKPLSGGRNRTLLRRRGAAVVPHFAPTSSLSPGTPLGRTEVAASADSSGQRQCQCRSFEILLDPCCDSAVGAHNFIGIEGAILEALRKTTCFVYVLYFLCRFFP